MNSTGVIDKPYRGQGLGRDFLQLTEEMCKDRGLRWSILGTTPQLSKMFIKFGYKYCDWRVESIGSGVSIISKPV